jgi:hypothetical protein
MSFCPTFPRFPRISGYGRPLTLSGQPQSLAATANPSRTQISRSLGAQWRGQIRWKPVVAPEVDTGRKAPIGVVRWSWRDRPFRPRLWYGSWPVACTTIPLEASVARAICQGARQSDAPRLLVFRAILCCGCALAPFNILPQIQRAVLFSQRGDEPTLRIAMMDILERPATHDSNGACGARPKEAEPPLLPRRAGFHRFRDS